MAETLSINSSNISVGWDLQNTTGIGVNAVNSSSISYSKTFTNGTGAGKAQKIYATILSPTASGGTASLDLQGSLEDMLGVAVTFSNVKGIYIEHQTTGATGGDLNISGNFFSAGGSQVVLEGTGPSINLVPGGALYICTGTVASAGYNVTATSGDTITLTNNATSGAVDVRIVIFGE